MHKVIGALVLALLMSFGSALSASAAVNVNTATKDELISLPGIGPAKAQAILDYRKANGPFKAVDDLRNVKGIGAKRLEKLRNEVSVGAVPPKTPAVSAKAEVRGAAPAARGEVRKVADGKPVK